MQHCRNCGDVGNFCRCTAPPNEPDCLRTDGGRRNGNDSRKSTRSGRQPRRQQGPPSQAGDHQNRAREGQSGSPRRGGQGGHQRGRGDQPPGREPPPERGPPPSGGGSGSSGPDLGRREFLLGGAGIAAAAFGGWWVFLRGPDGAKGVVAEAFEALDDNDWETFAGLFHPDSTMIQQIEEREGVHSYEDFLEDIGSLETQEHTDYEVLGLHEMDHGTDLQGSTPRGIDPAEHDIEEYKEILAIVERDRSGWEELDEDDDPTDVSDETMLVVQNGDGEWKLW